MNGWYMHNTKSLGNVKAENSKSFDLGFEKFFTDLNLEVGATYFNLKYNDTLEGWKTGNSSGFDTQLKIFLELYMYN